jgi:hypothetical protein
MVEIDVDRKELVRSAFDLTQPFSEFEEHRRLAGFVITEQQDAVVVDRTEDRLDQPFATRARGATICGTCDGIECAWASPTALNEACQQPQGIFEGVHRTVPHEMRNLARGRDDDLLRL